MRIVIMGASGNIGTAILERAADPSAGGADEYVGVARRDPGNDRVYQRARWHLADVTDPAATDRLTQIFTGADAVVNLVWGFQPGRDAGYLERVGVGGLRAVLAAARRAGVPHLVHMSSVGAYAAGHGRRVDESWSIAGIPASVYSRQKAAAERVLDADEATGGGPVVARLRPGLVLHRAAGSSLLRYGLPGWWPSWVLDLAAVLPLPGDFAVPVVHAHDLADAVLATVRGRATGSFNLAADQALTAADIAGALRAIRIPVPGTALRAVVAAGWALRLQRLDPGWIDLALAVPLLDNRRARTELDWQPRYDARTALQDLLAGMRGQQATSSPVLRTRTVARELWSAVRSGPITRRPMA